MSSAGVYVGEEDDSWMAVGAGDEAVRKWVLDGEGVVPINDPI